MALLAAQAHSIIAGNEYSGQEHFDVENPATREVISTVSQVDLMGLEQALSAANASFKTLTTMSAHQRGAVLYRWYELIVSHKNELAELITLEQGKVLKEAMAEVDYAAGFVKWFAEEAKRSYGEVIPSTNPQQILSTVKQGVGVVFGVTPWNFPLAMITRKVAPAYAAGCSFILKPSELTPLGAIVLAKLALQAGFEQSAFQVIVSPDAAMISEYLCAQSTVRKVTFTGSTRVGQLLLQQSANTIKRTSLELGGNAPFIVFETADLDAAIQGLMIAKFRNTGQTCVAANRVLVDSSCAKSFTEKLIDQVASLKVGNGLIEGNDLGPLIHSEAKQKAQELVKQALEQGAELLYQGAECEGSFMSPIILGSVTMDMAISKAEIFAPVICLFRFDDESQALEIANGVNEGLAAYFYSQDLSQVQRVSGGLEFGMVGINEAMISNPVAPFGGMKYSGLGREGAKQGLDEYQEIKYLCQRF